MKKRVKKSVIRRARLVPRGDGLEIVSLGHQPTWRGDIYVRLLESSWPTVALIAALVYLSLNLLFASAYYEAAGSIENARPGSFADAFFFSVQTMSTIGYGKLLPATLLANLLVTAEAFTGFAYFALVTGIVFAKFSRPTARVLFSKFAVIGPHNGAPHLMIRLANERGNSIVDAKVHLVVQRAEITKEGMHMRRMIDIVPLRDRMPVLRLSWTLYHKIDEKSPLYKATQDSLRESEAEIIVSLSGVDDSLSQNIYARYSYVADEIVCNASYVDILKRTPEGRVEVNYDLMHDVKKLPAKD